MKRVPSTDELEREAATVRRDLDLDRLLSPIGQVHLVGSAALGLMVWRDLDLTVVCQELHVDRLYRAGAAIMDHRNVRQLTVRNDTGPWNADPAYPDGVYWGVDYRDGDRHWNLDIWFVDDETRQPDLIHLRELAPRLTAETKQAILAIKGALAGTAEYGSSVRSYDIYQAVLDHGVRSLDDFEHYRRQTSG